MHLLSLRLSRDSLCSGGLLPLHRIGNVRVELLLLYPEFIICIFLHLLKAKIWHSKEQRRSEAAPSRELRVAFYHNVNLLPDFTDFVGNLKHLVL